MENNAGQQAENIRVRIQEIPLNQLDERTTKVNGHETSTTCQWLSSDPMKIRIYKIRLSTPI